MATKEQGQGEGRTEVAIGMQLTGPISIRFRGLGKEASVPVPLRGFKKLSHEFGTFVKNFSTFGSSQNKGFLRKSIDYMDS
jgi:hypothetical protein